MVSARILTLSLTLSALAFGQVESGLAKNAFDRNNLPARIEPSPPNKLTPEQRGDLYMARKMYREAIDAYREGSLNSAVIWNKIGIACHQLGDFAAARRDYEKAIRLDRNYADAVNNAGAVLYAEKRYRSAISRYRKALKLQPDTASFWSNLGTAYYSRGKFVDMTKAYEKALSLDPNIFERRGTVGTELQDRTVADRARYHYELARMYAKAGKNELALQYLRRSLEEGLKDKVKMTQAPEFAGLRELPEFEELLKLEPRVL
ncbi:MAG TPA: tetratricopeptide repeat protein [Bryobacteraceae bacterium]|nr:tetratricopeptide repeat protein [Bryobacteraceae bacterium]